MQRNSIYLFFVFIFFLQNMIPIVIISDYVNFVLGLLLLLFSPRGDFYPADRQLTRWYLTFMVFIFISSFWSISPKMTLFVLIFRVFPLFCFVFTLTKYITSYTDLFRILRLFYIASVILLLFFISFVNLSTVGDERLSVGEDYSHDWNINSVAMEFAIAIYVGFFLFWKTNKKNLRLLWLIVSFAMLFVILITGSRKGFGFLIIPLVVFSFYEFKGHFYYAVGLIAVGIAVIYAMMNISFLYDLMGARLVETVDIVSGDSDHTQDNSRVLLIQAGWEWFLQKPILGYGMNCFRVLSNNHILFWGKNWYAHNNYIEIMVGGGIIGILVYYSYLVPVIKRFWGHRDLPYKMVGALLLVLIFADTAQVGYYTPDLQFLILLVFAILDLEEKKYNNLQVSSEL